VASWVVLVPFAACIAALVAFAESHPTGADAWGYMFYAFRFRMHGLLHDFGTVRTYGYPLFLTLLTYLSGFGNDRLVVAAAVVQAVLYAGAAFWLSARLRVLGKPWPWAALIGTLLSPMALVLVSDALTDGLSLILFVSLSALALQLSGPYARWRTEGSMLAGAVIVAYALMVRPANLPVLAAWHLAILIGVGLAPQWRAVRGRLALVAVLSFLAAGAAIWGPQALYALRNYGQASILPLCQLGGLQTAFGIIAWKYDTLIANREALPWFHLNPLFSGPISADGGWRWYLENPGQGLATLLAHVFMSFSADTPFVYIRDLHPSYGPVFRAVTWLLCILGLVRTGAFALFLWRSRAARLEALPRILPLAFLLLACLGITALNSIAAVESRFNVIPITVLSVIALAYLIRFFRREVSPGRGAVSGVLGTTLLCIGLSYAADRLGSAEYQSRAQLIPGQKGDRCAVTREPLGWPDLIRRHEAEMAARR
jgi:hypothetical protein